MTKNLQQIVDAIIAGKMGVVVGAGLSMGSPSNLPSAVAVAQECAGKYRVIHGVDLSQSLNIEDLEAVAGYFFELDFPLFIDQLVPWREFNREPNYGHRVIADWILCGAVRLVLSGNYDRLIERVAEEKQSDIHGDLTVEEAERCTNPASLIKIHGCMTGIRDQTIWAREQLDLPEICQRLERLQTYLSGKLAGKDLMLIGFGADWSHLNASFETSLNLTDSPNRVYFVNPQEWEEFREQANSLINVFEENGGNVIHVREYASEFLVAISNRLSEVILSTPFKKLGSSAEICDQEIDEFIDENLNKLGFEERYFARCDFDGVASNQAVKSLRLEQHEALAAIHLKLAEKSCDGSLLSYKIDEDEFRVINGKQRSIVDVQKDFELEPPGIRSPKKIVVVSSRWTGKGPIIPDSSSGNVATSSHGRSYISDQEVLSELQIV